MPTTTAASPELRNAADLIGSGREAEARAILIEYIRKNPNSDHAWSLMSFVVPEPEKQVDCLQRALRINPGNFLAQSRLNQVQHTLVAAQHTAAALRISQPARPARLPAGPLPEPEVVPPAFQVEPPEEPDSTPSAFLPDPIQELRESGAGSVLFNQVQPDPEEEAVPAAPLPAKAQIPVPCLWIVLGVLVFLVLGSAIGVIVMMETRVNQEFYATKQALGLIPTMTPYRTLPATWTPIPTQTAQPTRTPRPTELPTLTPTFISPSSNAAEELNQVEKQVSSIRGLPALADVTRYILPKPRAEEVLSAQISKEDLASLKLQQRILTSFGLIQPSYDMVRLAMNHMADHIGGFYLPQLDEIYVLGLQISGVERFIYTHEYNHALQDQHFDLQSAEISPDCSVDQQACQAVRALVEGDSTLVMAQWLEEQASAQDSQDILRYRPPSQVLPDQFPAPYVTKELSFPYQQGLEFVTYLYERGLWARVNQAYQSPPLSTEHILHPEKYVNREAPVQVEMPDLPAVLGPGWDLLSSNVLGEWNTYLVLGHGADLASQIDDYAAQQAAAGWGGDRFQIYYNPSLLLNLMVVRWDWDSSEDGAEFHSAMREHLDARFRSSRLDSMDGSACWAASKQIACLYERDQQTLWITGPNLDVINLVKQQFPDF